jgi:hypothetical protein
MSVATEAAILDIRPNLFVANVASWDTVNHLDVAGTGHGGKVRLGDYDTLRRRSKCKRQRCAEDDTNQCGGRSKTTRPYVSGSSPWSGEKHQTPTFQLLVAGENAVTQGKFLRRYGLCLCRAPLKIPGLMSLRPAP